MARALSLGLAHDLVVDTPLARMHKDAVIRLGVELGVPLELTLSCMNPETARTAASAASAASGAIRFATPSACPTPPRYATVPIR